MAGIQLPPQMKTTGDPLENFKLFRRNWEQYEIATERTQKPYAVRLATLLLAMGEECLRVYDTLINVDNRRIDSILDGLEIHFINQGNSANATDQRDDDSEGSVSIVGGTNLQESNLMLATVQNMYEGNGNIIACGNMRRSIPLGMQLSKNDHLDGMSFFVKGEILIEGPISEIRDVIKAMSPVIVSEAIRDSPTPVSPNAQSFIAHELHEDLRSKYTNNIAKVNNQKLKNIYHAQEFQVDIKKYTKHPLIPEGFPRFEKPVSQRLILANSSLGLVNFQYKMVIAINGLYQLEDAAIEGGFVFTYTHPLHWDEQIMKIVNAFGKRSDFSVNAAIQLSFKIMRRNDTSFLEVTEEQAHGDD